MSYTVPESAYGARPAAVSLATGAIPGGRGFGLDFAWGDAITILFATVAGILAVSSAAVLAHASAAGYRRGARPLR